MFWSPPVATLASRWSTFLSSRVSFSLRTLSRDLHRIVQLYCYLLKKKNTNANLQLMSKLLRKSAILLMLPVMSSMYSLLTQSACVCRCRLSLWAWVVARDIIQCNQILEEVRESINI